MTRWELINELAQGDPNDEIYFCVEGLAKGYSHKHDEEDVTFSLNGSVTTNTSGIYERNGKSFIDLEVDDR